MGTLVRTKLDCFIGGHLYRAGDTFELPAGMKPTTWMETQGVAEKPKAGPKAKPKSKAANAPETFSEMTKMDAEAYDIEGAHDLF
jgi:hypothetical protein